MSCMLSETQIQTEPYVHQFLTEYTSCTAIIILAYTFLISSYYTSYALIKSTLHRRLSERLMIFYSLRDYWSVLYQRKPSESRPCLMFITLSIHLLLLSREITLLPIPMKHLSSWLSSAYTALFTSIYDYNLTTQGACYCILTCDSYFYPTTIRSITMHASIYSVLSGLSAHRANCFFNGGSLLWISRFFVLFNW